MKSKILIGLIALALICCGCVEEDVSELLLIEYNKHADTRDDDLTRLDTIFERWNTAYTMAAADGFTAEEVDQLIDIANEYRDESEFVKSHLTSFKEFIVANEEELKDAGVDTYQTKKDIDDANIIIQQNIEEVMIPDLEYADEYVETSEQEEATGTGFYIQTIEEVASNIEITGIVGARADSTTNDFEHIKITMKVMAGAEGIDIGQFRIALQNKTKRIDNIEYTTDADPTNLTSSQFYVVEIRDEDNSLDTSSTTTTVINSGDLVYLVLKPGTTVDFPTREPVRIEIKPEFGASVTNEFTTPSSYGVTINIVLY